MILRKRITIVHVRKPKQQSLNEELRWFGTSLGLFGERDRDKSCFRLFIEILKAAKRGEALSSDKLSQKIGLSRGTTVHHLNTLIEQGLVLPIRRRYILRDRNLEILMSRLRADFEQAYKELENAAREIDEILGL